MNRSAPSAPGLDVALLLALYLLESAGLAILLSLHRLGDRTGLPDLASVPGVVFWAGALGLVISAGLIAVRYSKARKAGDRRFAMTAALNAVTLVLVLAAGEATVRLIATPSPAGPTAFGTLLLPRSWDEAVARNTALARKIDAGESYLVSDPRLGWTFGPNRTSADGLYKSSAEGIRSPREGHSFGDTRPKHRVALVGDSYTFAQAVVYEDTWGHQLERALGPDYQVLNFGIPGYGMDQAYLRFKEEVRQWRPDYVIFGVAPHDIVRSMTVYTFVSFPDWALPFSKPRFVLDDGDGLRLVNVPVPKPETVLSTKSVEMLPHLEHDIGFNPWDWRRRFYHASYLIRFILSRYPSEKTVPEALSAQAKLETNRRILQEFKRLADREEMIPIVLYLPNRHDLSAASRPRNEPIRAMVRSLGVLHADLTDDLQTVPAADRFADDDTHYSPRSNHVIAERLKALIMQRTGDGKAE